MAVFRVEIYQFLEVLIASIIRTMSKPRPYSPNCHQVLKMERESEYEPLTQQLEALPQELTPHSLFTPFCHGVRGPGVCCVR